MTILGTKLGDSNFWTYYPSHYWSKLTCILALSKVEVVGKENISKDESYVFVANHQGAFDIFLIYGYLGHDFKWIMKQSLRNIPIVGQACEDANHIFIDDTGAKGVKSSMEKAIQTLGTGMSLVIFPEGSRTLDGKIHRFKKGAYQIADELKMPIVPLVIEGSFNVLKRGTLKLRPHRLKLTILPAIPFDPASEDEIKRRLDLSFNNISEVLNH
ncbi:MAG: lysophospholipid acyltransferase family protein [Bacteroidales bacterium]|nr:lysophospholipid acyltransferase family protein [Bacteroidales bacterium]